MKTIRKRFLSLAIVFAMVLSLSAISAVAETNGKTVYLSLKYVDASGVELTAPVAAETNFKVIVSIAGLPTTVDTSMQAYDILVGYDNTKMSPTSSVPQGKLGGIKYDGSYKANSAYNASTVWVGWSSTTGYGTTDEDGATPVTTNYASGTLFEIWFKAGAAGVSLDDLKTITIVESAQGATQTQTTHISDKDKKDFTYVIVPALQVADVSSGIYTSANAAAVKAALGTFTYVDKDGASHTYTAEDVDKTEWNKLTITLPEGGLSSETANTCTATYGDVSTTFSVTAAAVKVTKLEVTTQPTLTYSSGDKLDLSDMVVKATYNNGETNANYKGYTPGIANETELTVKDHNGQKITLTDNTVSTVTTETNALTVNKKAVTVPTPDNTFTYDGSEKTFIEDGTYYTVSGDTKKTDAGGYEATVTLRDTNETEWATTFSGSLSWRIDKADVTSVTLASTHKYNTKYSALEDTAEASDANGKTETATITWYTDNTYDVVATDENAIATSGDIGKTVTLYYKATGMKNHKNYSGTLTVTVTDKTELTGITFTAPTTNPVYDGSALVAGTDFTAPTHTNAAEASGWTYSYKTSTEEYTAGLPTDAGTYTIKASYADDNYKGEATITLTIDQASVTKPTVKGTYTYTGSEQTVELNDFVEAKMAYVSSSNKATTADTHTVTLSLQDAKNYKWKDGNSDNLEIEWTIAKAKITNNGAFSDYSASYDGKSHGIGYDAAKLSTVDSCAVTVTYSTDGESYSGTAPTQTDYTAAPVTVYWKAEAANHETLTGSKTITVKKAELTIDAVTVADKTYDGTTDNASVTNVTFTGVQNAETLALTADYTVSGAAYASANAADSVTVTGTVALTASETAGNYTLESGSFETTGKIAKAAAKTGVTGAVSVYYLAAGEQSVTVSMFSAFNDVAGADIKSISEANDTQNIIASTAKTGFTLTSAMADTCVGKTATLNVVISSTNYEDTTAALTVTLINKTGVSTALSLSDITRTYDGTNAYDVAGSYTGTTDSTSKWTYQYEGKPGTTYNKSTTKPTDAGTYKIYAHYEDDILDNGVPGHQGDITATLTINKRDVTITSASDSKAYNGTALTNSNTSVTSGSFVDGEGYVANVIGTQTEVGSSANNFTVSTKAGTNLANYNITKTEGTLTVTGWDQAVKITAKSNSKMYDGAALTESGYTVTGLAAGHTISVTTAGTITHFGTAANEVTEYTISDADGNDVTAAYSDITTVDGTLSVTKRDVTITSDSSSKKYDGMPLTKETVTVTGSGFVDGEGATYYNFASQTAVGSTDNTFSYVLKNGTSADDYAITTANGKLTVTQNDTLITLTADSNSKTYDGKALTDSGYTVTGVLAAGDYFSSVTVSGTITDAGTTANKVTAYTVLNRAGDDVTSFYSNIKTADGTLTVTRADLSGLTVSMNGYTYAGTVSTPTLNGTNSGSGTMTYYYSSTNSNSGGTEWKNITATTLNADTYYMYAVVAQTTNYNSFTTPAVSFTIAKAAYGDKTATGSARYGMSGSVDLSSLLKPGYTIGTITKTDTDGIFDGMPTVSDGKLSFTLTDNAANAGKTAAVTVPVTGCTNYKDYTITVTITVNDKYVPVISANNITVTYTGSAVSDSKITGTATYEGATVAGTWSFKAGQDLTDALDSGEKTVVFTPTNTNDYVAVETTITLTINKATPAGTPSYTAVKSSGKTLADANLTVGTITPAGTIAWDDDTSTKVEANKAYGWTFIPTDTNNYNVLTGSIVVYVYHPFNGHSIVIEETNHGTVIADTPSAKAGDVVTLTAAADKGYKLYTLSVTDLDGDMVDITRNKNGSYSFEMPNSSVYVSARFVRSEGFTDVDPDSFCYDAVEWAVSCGVTNGLTETEFGPKVACTRAQVVTFLWRAAGCPQAKSAANPFTDVKKGAYYYDAVLWAVEQGITKGLTETTFVPDKTVTRAQFVTFLYRFEDSPAPDSKAVTFTDVKADAYYADAVAWAVENGITKGLTATSFGPGATCNRGQVVTFLYRCFNNK